jgi:hypothetical protein
MNTSNAIQTFTISTEAANLVREGAAKERSATGAKKKAAEALAAEGARGHMFTKEAVKDKIISAETLASIQGSIAAGLLTKVEFTLWASGSKAAKKAGKQEERNALTSEVNSYLASFRKMIETAWRTLNPELAKAEDDEGKAEDDEGEADDKEAAPEVTGADLRKRLLDLIADVAASELEHRELILADLNCAEGRMSAW